MFCIVSSLFHLLSSIIYPLHITHKMAKEFDLMANCNLCSPNLLMFTLFLPTSFLWNLQKSALQSFPAWNPIPWPLPLPVILIFHGKPCLHFICNLKYSFSDMLLLKAFFFFFLAALGLRCGRWILLCCGVWASLGVVHHKPFRLEKNFYYRGLGLKEFW